MNIRKKKEKKRKKIEFRVSYLFLLIGVQYMFILVNFVFVSSKDDIYP